MKLLLEKYFKLRKSFYRLTKHENQNKMLQIEIKILLFSKISLLTNHTMYKKLKNRWVWFYLIYSSFEFGCWICSLSCHEFALFKLFWNRIFDDLTMSAQQNAFKLTKARINLIEIKKIVNLLDSERTIFIITVSASHWTWFASCRCHSSPISVWKNDHE